MTASFEPGIFRDDGLGHRWGRAHVLVAGDHERAMPDARGIPAEVQVAIASQQPR
jgi:hypothetical protein